MDLDNSPTLVKAEFIAVVLAGFGHELRPLTSNHGEEPCPKALLPIGNRPMIDYILAWLETSGITDVLLICPTAHRISIADHIHSDASASFPSLRIDLQTYGDQHDVSFGTCSILRHFAYRIERDFLVLPCDLIPPPSFPLSIILNKFRQESTLDDSICTTFWFETPRYADKHIADEWSPAQSSVPILWDEKTETLLHVDVPDRLGRSGDELKLRMSLLSIYPRSKLSNVLQDSSVYACSRSVLDVLQSKPTFESLRQEFIPWLCKIDHQDIREEKYKSVLKLVNRLDSQKMSLQHSTSNSRDRYKHNGCDPVFSSDLTRMSRVRVGLVIHRVINGFAARANNLYSYLELNQRFLEQMGQGISTDLMIHRTLINAKAQVSADSVVGYSTSIDEQASIKKSVIGKHCVIGKMVKIIGCVILDHCVIGDGAKLEGCILGKNTKVGDRSELMRCVLQAGYEVDAAEQYHNEKLDLSEWTTNSVYRGFDSTSSSDSESD